MFRRHLGKILWEVYVVRILYVEDYPAQRDVMAQMLELIGFEVDLAVDGLEGYAKAIDNPPDLILTDLNMPRMDGFKTIRKLRSSARTAHIPIITLSARTGKRQEKRALAAGANQHFSKPVDLKQLIPAINSHLKHLARA